MDRVDRGHLLQIRPGPCGLPDRQLHGILAQTVAVLRSSQSQGSPHAGYAGYVEHAGLVGLLFFENSTRTRLSFTAAAHALGAGVLDLNAAASSVHKGETFIDTAFTVEAMGARALVVRSREGGVPQQIARALGATGSDTVVLNAGDGRHEHPTQAMIDAVTLGERLGRLGDRTVDHTGDHTGDHTQSDGRDPYDPRAVLDLSGLRVAIVGDVLNSRVARSGAALLTRLGAGVVCCGPEAIAPDAFGRAIGVPVVRDLDALAGTVDAVLMLRVQFERHQQDTGLDQSAYRHGYAMTAERLARFDAALGRATIIMHPGPMNRGLEIDGSAADGPNSVIRRQVAVGVAVRTALLARAFAPGPVANNQA